jgi:hypothetical protein
MPGARETRSPAARAEYQVRVIEGVQRFRMYPDGKKESEEVPNPRLNGWVLPADEWSKLPKMVGTEFRLKVHQAADLVVSEQRMKVFQYYASVEDTLCSFAPVEDFGFFTISKAVPVACYGEIWADEDANIIRMSKHLELSDKLKDYRGWDNAQFVLTYGWLKRANEPPRLVPLTIFTEARDIEAHLLVSRPVYGLSDIRQSGEDHSELTDPGFLKRLQSQSQDD